MSVNAFKSGRQMGKSALNFIWLYDYLIIRCIELDVEKCFEE